MSFPVVNLSSAISVVLTDGNFSSWDEAGERTGGLQPHSMTHLFTTLVILGAIILSAIVGNVFVMAAVVLERNLRNVANYLVVSLAVADMMVATLVMPLAAVNEVSRRWFLGREVCDMWVSFDVICCTSSILHLVAISLDRYWAVTRVDYIHNRSAKRILAMIGASWTLSFMISIPPLFLKKDPNYDPNKTGTCIINQDPGYTIYSTVGAFYLPCVLMMIIYLRIFLAARARIRKKQFRTAAAAAAAAAAATTVSRGETADSLCPVADDDDDGSTGSHSPIEGTSMTTFMMTVNSAANSPEHPSNGAPSASAGGALANDPCTRYLHPPTTPPTTPTSPCKNHSSHLTTLHTQQQQQQGLGANLRSSFLDLTKQYRERKHETTLSPSKTKEKRAKERMEQKRERKAARTLAIITGSFICCWLPFFILALIRPFCRQNCDYPPLLMTVINWLGYFNSLLNPIIYTVFNPDFRSAFRKILFGKYRRRYKYQPANSTVH